MRAKLAVLFALLPSLAGALPLYVQSPQFNRPLFSLYQGSFSTAAAQAYLNAITNPGGSFGAPRYTTALLPSCTSGNNKGALAFDTTDAVLKVCDGSSWAATGGGGGGGLADPGGNGVVVRTASGITTARTLTAGTGVIVTDGNGVAGNPVFDVDTSIIPIYASGTASVPATGTVGSFYFETDRNAAYTYPSTNTETWLLSLAAGAGTSGGVPYFTGTADTLASSAALTANLPVIGGGAGAAPAVGTRSGNTTAYVTTTGAQTSGDCVKIDANGNHIANGSACGGGGGGWSLSAKTFSDTPITVGTTNIAYSCDATDGATVFNLPACSTNANLIVILKKIDSSVNKCELARNGADTIDGQTVWDIITQYGSVMIQCNGGTAWYLE